MGGVVLACTSGSASSTSGWSQPIVIAEPDQSAYAATISALGGRLLVIGASRRSPARTEDSSAAVPVRRAIVTHDVGSQERNASPPFIDANTDIVRGTLTLDGASMYWVENHGQFRSGRRAQSEKSADRGWRGRTSLLLHARQSRGQWTGPDTLHRARKLDWDSENGSSIVRLADGSVFLATAEISDAGSRIIHVRHKGSTASISGIPANAPIYVTTDADSLGRVVVAFVETGPDNVQVVRVAASADGGQTWLPTETVGPSDQHAHRVRVALQRDAVHLLWVHRGPESTLVHARRPHDSSRWLFSAPYRLVGEVVRPQLRVDSCGTVHVAADVYVDDAVHVTYVELRDGRWEPAVRPFGGARSLSPAMALSDGRLHLTALRNRILVEDASFSAGERVYAQRPVCRLSTDVQGGAPQA